MEQYPVQKKGDREIDVNGHEFKNLKVYIYGKTGAFTCRHCSDIHNSD